MRTHIRQVLAVGLLTIIGIAGAAVVLPAEGQSETRRGALIAPVPLKMKGLNRALVLKGSYIVNAQGGCNDCHTVPSYIPGRDPFQGEQELVNAPCYLAGGAEFGPFTSRNITPRENGRPAGRTLAQFKSLMRTGKATPTSRTLQVMPWPVYGKMTDNDLEAVYEYLSAIPSILERPDYCVAPPPPPMP
jgi:hypothetical protein